MAPPSGLGSETGVTYHGKMFLAHSIGRNPGAAAIALATLLVLTIVLIVTTIVYHSKWKSCLNPKSGYVTANSNLATGSNNPIWHLGAGDAGNWGSVARDTTATQAGAYMPREQHTVKRQMARRAAFMRAARRMSAERMSEPDGKGMCPAGTDKYLDDDGRAVCLTPDEAWGGDDSDGGSPLDPSACGLQWDPAAIAETQALATMGALESGPLGETRLATAVGSAFDTSKSLSDDQLSQLMFNGSAP